MNFDNIQPILLAIVAALPGLLSLSLQKRKDKVTSDTATVDNAKKISDQAILLLTPYNQKFEEMEQDIKELKESLKAQDVKIKDQDKKIEEQDDIIRLQSIQLADQERQLKKFKLGIKKLIDQIIKLGHVPDWEPEGD